MGKSRKDYEKFLNSISPDRDDEAWIIGGKNRYCGRENYGTMIKRYDPIGFNVGYREWSTRGYNQGDYIKGIAYVTKEKYDNEVCNKEGDWKEDCAKIIDNEVKSIGMWMWGDVKGYALEKKVAFTKKYKDESREDEDCEEWEEVDSCWGYYEETDELIKEVMIENGLEE